MAYLPLIPIALFFAFLVFGSIRYHRFRAKLTEEERKALDEAEDEHMQIW